MNKTNAIRILEKDNISFTTHSYNVDEKDLSGLTVAKKINANPDLVFKTLVAKGDKNIFVFCIPVTTVLDLKRAAKITNTKKIELINLNELQRLTGYIRGGCSPIGMKKKYATYIDESAILYNEIYVSAGIRGMQVKLKPADLVKVVDGYYCDLRSNK